MATCKMKIKIAQLYIKTGQIKSNAEKMLHIISEAKNENCDLVVFPAAALTGFKVEKQVFREEFWEEAEFWRNKLISASDGVTVVWGDLLVQKDCFCDTFFAYQNKKLISTPKSNQISILGLLDSTIEILLPNDEPISSNSNLTLRLARDSYQKDTSPAYIEDGEKIVSDYGYINSVGINDQGSFIEILQGQSGWKNRNDKFTPLLPYFKEGSVSFTTSLKLPEPNESIPKMELLFQSLCYSGKYFLDHLGLSKVLIGLSGGIDSALSTCIYSQILPSKNLLLVNMPSRFNSDVTKSIAAKMAKEINCWYGVMPIEEIIHSTLMGYKSTTFIRNGEELTLPLSTLTIENLQARTRTSQILSTLSSGFGGVIACNSNKSETSVGYGTLYGDSAGFLTLIGDLWKIEIYELLAYLKEKPEFKNAIPDELFTTPPSAELSENHDVTKGLGDPIHYSYHDKLFQSFCEWVPNVTPLVALRWYQEGILEEKLNLPKGKVAELFKSPTEFIQDLEYWWRQYNGLSSAKRVQSAPSLSLSSRSFGKIEENQIPWIPTQAYEKLKNEILFRGE